MSAIGPPALILVSGGIRSGKSRFAEGLARQAGGRVLYLATGAASDPEMRARIEEHRRRRPPGWETLEIDRHLAQGVRPLIRLFRVVLLEDLGGLVSNLMLATAMERRAEMAPLETCRQALGEELEALARVRGDSQAIWVVVTHEVGSSLVPTNPLGRQFVELLGWANQLLAAQADRFYLLVAGYAIDVTRVGQRVE